MAKFITVVFTLFLSFSVVSAENVPNPADENARHYIEVPEGGLPDFFKWVPRKIALVSHHRAGPAPGYPENAIATMDNALKYGPGLMEVDVMQLKDGTLILMHDYTLGRTTTGEGEVKAKTWDQVKGLKLKDNDGNVTEYGIPRLKDVLLWARGKTILTLDIKRGTDFKKVVDLVRETGSEDYSVGIAYSLSQAQAFHKLAPFMPITVSIGDAEELKAVKESGIAKDKIIAWTGTRIRDAAHYQAIHKEGWTVFMGTLGREGQSLDSQFRANGNDVAYREIIEMGADVIATDRFWAVQPQILNKNIYFFHIQGQARR